MIVSSEIKPLLENHIQECLDSKVNVFYISRNHRFRQNYAGYYELEERMESETDNWQKVKYAEQVADISDFIFIQLEVACVTCFSKE
jgi:hypothetical protein